MTTAPIQPRRNAQSGPPLPLLIIVSVALFAAGLIAAAALAGGQPFVPPDATDADLLSFFGAQHDAVRVNGFFQVGSSVPLLIFAATASVRLQRLGIRAPGAVIALTGGVLAAISLAISGFVLSALAIPGVTGSVPLLHALTQLSFAAGGAGTVAGLGLLVAGIAVPGLIAGLLPRAVAIAGLLIAVICELGVFSLLSTSLAPLLPVGRFPALIWLVAAAFLMPSRRAAANQADKP